MLQTSPLYGLKGHINPMNFLAFMCHAPTSDYNYLETTLQEYNVGQYLIGHESTPYEHYHFLVQMSSDDYHLFAERVFRKKYKLRGRATKDNPRQYGKLKKIEDLEKLKSYTIKDGNYRSNMPEQDVKKYFENSFKKIEKKKIYQEIFETIELEKPIEIIRFMDDYARPTGNNMKQIIKKIILLIINYLRINTDINMCRSNVLSYTQFFFKNTSHYSPSEKDELIYSLLF